MIIGSFEAISIVSIVAVSVVEAVAYLLPPPHEQNKNAVTMSVVIVFVLIFDLFML